VRRLAHGETSFESAEHKLDDFVPFAARGIEDFRPAFSLKTHECATACDRGASVIREGARASPSRSLRASVSV
jgi:hypothetical protein